MRTALYRHFDAEGALLYVGISLSAVQRLSQHKSGSKWFEQIRRVTIEWHDSREKALRAEATAISQENPRHNLQRPAKPKVEPNRPMAVRHLKSGRIDGWYMRPGDAEHICGWFGATFPNDRFDVVESKGGPDSYITREMALRWPDWAEWAASPPDHAAGDAFDRAAA